MLRLPIPGPLESRGDVSDVEAGLVARSFSLVQICKQERREGC
jgi:hypothetical protein